jgi:hypothetical protein
VVSHYRAAHWRNGIIRPLIRASITAPCAAFAIALTQTFRRYTRAKLWNLFLIAAFLLHVWTIILFLDDFSWVAERTKTWDAIGAGAYGLVYALLESGVIFLALALAGFLLPKRQPEDKRIATLSTLYLGSALWAIAAQLYSLHAFGVPSILIFLSIRIGHPLWVLYGCAIALIGLTVIIPAAIVYRSDRASVMMINFIDRLSVLVAIYLVLDIAAILIVIGRNL